MPLHSSTCCRIGQGSPKRVRYHTPKHVHIQRHPKSPSLVAPLRASTSFAARYLPISCKSSVLMAITNHHSWLVPCSPMGHNSLSFKPTWIRHCEFARAALQCIFDNSLPQLHYLGFVKKEFYPKVQEALSSLGYEFWDTSEESGPKIRPRETAEENVLGLKLLAMFGDCRVVWPDTLMGRFPPGSEEHKALAAKKLQNTLKMQLARVKPLLPAQRPAGLPRGQILPLTTVLRHWILPESLASPRFPPLT